MPINTSPQAYLPLLILVVVAVGFGAIAIGLPHLLGPTRKNKQKLEPYESGIIPFMDARRRFPVKYYLVAMLFILFDIEVIFIYLWAMVFKTPDLMLPAFISMLVFVGILLLGLAYAWRKGALTWR